MTCMMSELSSKLSELPLVAERINGHMHVAICISGASSLPGLTPAWATAHT